MSRLPFSDVFLQVIEIGIFNTISLVVICLDPIALSNIKKNQVFEPKRLKTHTQTNVFPETAGDCNLVPAGVMECFPPRSKFHSDKHRIEADTGN